MAGRVLGFSLIAEFYAASLIRLKQCSTGVNMSSSL